MLPPPQQMPGVPMGDGSMQTAHWLSVTLYSIGDAVIATDADSRVTFMNPVAESLTGWTAEEAAGAALDAVFKIVNEESRETVESPVAKALREGAVVGLANHTLLIAKDGSERPIDDSAAPIRDETGEVAGVVLVFRDISERKQHEQALRDSLDYADNIIATLRESFLVLGKDLRVVSANRCFYETFQAAAEETVGRFVFDLGDGQWDVPALRALLDEVLSNNHPVDDFEVEHDFPTIGVKVMRLNARRIRKPGNHSELILVAIEDVTERRQAEAAIAHLAAIVASSKDAIISKDLNGIITSWNTGAQRLFGYAADEVIGKSVTLLIPSDRRDEEPAILERIRRGEAVEHYETARRHKDGSLRDFSLTVSPIRDAGGRIIGASKIARDITGRKRLERDLHESEVRYRRLFESAKDGILILDAETMAIEDSNPFMHELLGYSKEEFEGKQLWEIGLFQDKSESQTAMRTLQREGYVRYEDLPLESGHGKVRQVEFICNVYQEDHHSVAQCNIRDITERKAMERRIQDQAKELADAGRRKDEFLAMLSHELRNPMAPIFNALQLIGDQGGESELQREGRGVIERQVRHLSRLVDDLLEISRITTGRIRLHTERVDVKGIVTRAVERMRSAIERRGQQLTVGNGDGVLWLDADSARLEQVVGNLLNNASKYNDADGLISLAVERQDGHAVIRVQDDGIGMAPDLLPRIFDLFTQADKSLDRSEGGLGIGLALVKNLVELHRGTVEARSAGLGQGSEFVVRLPLASDGTATQPISTPAPAAPASTESLRILVVDDNVDAAKMSSLLLRSWGHEVRTAHDGPAALLRATGFHPQVILCDIGLPDMDGYEVARHIRQNPHLKDVRLAAVTGYGQDSDRQRSQEAGFDFHLVKPVEAADLKALLAGIRPLTS